MGVLGEALRLFTHSGFGSARNGASIRGLLARSSYEPVSPVLPDQFVLRLHEPSDYASALTNEFCETAQSSFESILEVERGTRVPRATAWPAIKTYYSAYFAGHALIRFAGQSCSWLSGDDLDRAKSIASAYGMLPGHGPRRGQWRCKANISGELEFTLASGSGLGGSHEALWNCLSKVLLEWVDKAVNSPLLEQSVKQSLVLRLDEFREIIALGVPLDVRHAVNYRREYGGWFPYGNSHRDVEDLLRNMSVWRKGESRMDPIDGSSDITTMISFARNLVGFCLSLTEAAEKYLERGSGAFSCGPLRLVRCT